MTPRQISIPERLAILSGGFMSQFGWIFFGFGMIFFWVFVMNSTIVYWFSFRDWQESEGTVIRIEDTNAEVNDEDVYELIYEYKVNGNTYTGRSYSTGYAYSEGQAVPIEYDLDHPEESRVNGLRRAMFGWEVIFVVIFPLIGLIFILVGFRTNMKSLDLLINGKFARGKMISKEPTNTRINEQTVYKYTFEFEADNGRTYEATGKTHLTYLLEDEETERLIYAPNDPAYSTMFDTIPGAPKLNPDGSFQALSGKGYLSLILPVITVLLHGSIYLFMYVL